MAELSYLKLKNETTGEDVTGDVLDSAYADHIEVIAFNQETTRPTHTQTGQVTGETTYGALEIVKPIDKASPMLQMGLSQGNKFSGSILFLRTGSEGQREHWYTIDFEDASLVGISMYKPEVISESMSSFPRCGKDLISFREDYLAARAGSAGSHGGLGSSLVRATPSNDSHGLRVTLRLTWVYGAVVGAWPPPISVSLES